MIKKILLLFFILVGIAPLLAQQGDLYLNNYQIPIQNISHQNNSVIQSKEGLIYFANKQGILSYDGANWELIKTQRTPYVLALGDKIYVGGQNNFGYLKKNKKGVEQYISVSESGKIEDFGRIKQIIVHKEYVYFYSDQSLFQFSPKANKITQTWRARTSGEYQGIVSLNEEVFLNYRGKGLYRLVDKNFNKVANTDTLAVAYIQTYCPLNSKEIFICTQDNELFKFTGKRLKPFEPEAFEYILNNPIQYSFSLNDRLLVLATITGGAIVMDKANGRTQYLLNYQTGLPDDEVYALGKDELGGLWICHAAGISRSAFSLPLRTYSGFAGLEGNLESLLRFRDTLYVATSSGVYYLHKVERYEEVEGLARKEKNYLQTVETITRTVKILEPQQESRIRRYEVSPDGLKEEQRRIELEEEKETKRIPYRSVTEEKVVSLYVSEEARRAYALQSLPYIYKVIPGVEAKCRQMLQVGDEILVATNLGVLRINREGEEPIGEEVLLGEYVNFMYSSPRNKDYLYIGTQDGMSVLHFENQEWEEVAVLDSLLNSGVVSIVEEGNRLWLGSESKAFRLDIGEDFTLTNLKTFRFKNSYSEDIIIRKIKGQTAFILSTGIYSYSAKTNKIFKNPRLGRYFDARSPVFYKQEGYTWLRKTIWQNISEPETANTLPTIFLEFFEGIQDIYVDNTQNIWLIRENAIYKVASEAEVQGSEKFQTFIKSIYHRPNEFIPLTKNKFSYSQKGRSFTFKLASPFYQGEEEIEYSYWLEGLNEDWSGWDSQALISFPYLPSGKYTLHVKARNIYGQESKEQVFSFELEPPFWETYWFYGLQIAVLFGLLLLSFLFNRSGRRSRLSFVITLIALITVFEFLFLLVEPYVDDFSNGIPIVKLGMNIMVALSLVPIEKFLQKALAKPVKRQAESPDIDLREKVK